MAKTKISEYSATAASNTDIDGINLSEGVMVPSDINNAIREQMAHLKDVSDGTSGIDVLNLQDDDASASIKLQAPAEVTTTTTLTLPDGAGSVGQALVTDGSGVLSWATQADFGDWNISMVSSTATADSNGAVSSSTALTVDGNSGTIVVGMSVTGTGISGSVKVATVTSQTELVLDTAITIANDVALTFDSNNLVFSYNGTAVAKIASDGAITSANNVTAYGTI